MVAFKTGLRVAVLMIGLALVNSDPLLITRRHKRQSPRDLLPEWLSKRLPFNTKPNTAVGIPTVLSLKFATFV